MNPKKGRSDDKSSRRLCNASKVFLRDVVSCQSTDLSFLLAVLFNFVYLPCC